MQLKKKDSTVIEVKQFALIDSEVVLQPAKDRVDKLETRKEQLWQAKDTLVLVDNILQHIREGVGVPIVEDREHTRGTIGASPEYKEVAATN